MLTGLEIAAIIVGSITTYMVGIGVTQKVLHSCTEMRTDDCWLTSIFIWYLALPIVTANEIADRVPKAIRRRRELKILKKQENKTLPAIHIKENARIQTIDEYKQLKQLCADFEVEFEANKEVDKLLES